MDDDVLIGLGAVVAVVLFYVAARIRSKASNRPRFPAETKPESTED